MAREKVNLWYRSCKWGVYISRSAYNNSARGCWNIYAKYPDARLNYSLYAHARALKFAQTRIARDTRAIIMRANALRNSCLNLYRGDTRSEPNGNTYIVTRDAKSARRILNAGDIFIIIIIPAHVASRACRNIQPMSADNPRILSHFACSRKNRTAFCI